MVEEMWTVGTITPMPVQQDLRPIYDVLLTQAVKDIKHDDDGSLINADELYNTAVKYYTLYCTVMGNCDFPACPTIVRLDGDFYHETVHSLEGRKEYKDIENGNTLKFSEGEYTNKWIVVPSTSTDNMSIIKQTAPCPQSGGEFKNLVGEQIFRRVDSWEKCSVKCLIDINCNFWQYNKVDKVCKLIKDYNSINSAPKSATQDYLIGSKDCPGAAELSESSYGKCPNNIKSKTMWKNGNDQFFSKDSRIEAFDPTVVVITGIGQPEKNWNSGSASIVDVFLKFTIGFVYIKYN